MMETLLIIILAAGIGIFHNSNKPTRYALNMEDGSKTQIILQKNSQYACPLYCDVDHIHHAVICKSDKQTLSNKFVYHISEKNENGIAIYCSSRKILSMSKFIAKTSKDNLPDVVSASSEE